VLDVGCGDGAHCVGLAARGLAVTGLDASPAQLVRASQAAQAAGVAVQLVAGDMRQPPVDGPFDAIVCVGSTLGMYTDEDDRITLGHLRDRLAIGGRIVLHVLNRDYIVARLPARSWWQGQGCLVLDEAQMFAPTSRVHVHRTVVFETGKQFEHNLGLRLYSLTELVQMCAQVGLRVLEYSGGRHTRGRFYGATSSEIWLVAQRVE
jgi:SAM-dependent methyltransferase